MNSLTLAPVRPVHCGPDVSRYDNRRPDPTVDYEKYINDVPIDWDRMHAAGMVDVALICMSLGIRPDGNKWKLAMDPGFELSWTGAKSAGLPCIAWPVLFPAQNAIVTSGCILDYLGKIDFNPNIDRLALDFEVDDGVGTFERLKHLGSLVNELGKQGVIPFIYTNSDFMLESTIAWKNSGRDITWLKKYPLWLAWPPAEPKSGCLSVDVFRALRDSVASGAQKPYLPPNIWQGRPKGKWIIPEPWDLEDLYARGIWQFTWRLDPAQLPGHPGIKKQVDFNAIFYEIQPQEPVDPVTPPVVVDARTIEQKVDALIAAAKAHDWSV